MKGKLHFASPRPGASQRGILAALSLLTLCGGCGLALPPGIIDNGHWVNYWQTATIAPPVFQPDGSLVFGQGKAVRCLAPDLSEKWLLPADTFPYTLDTGPDGSVYYLTALPPEPNAASRAASFSQSWIDAYILQCLTPGGLPRWQQRFPNPDSSFSPGFFEFHACPEGGDVLTMQQSWTTGGTQLSTFRSISSAGALNWERSEPILVESWAALRGGALAYVRRSNAGVEDQQLVILSATGEVSHTGLAGRGAPEFISAGSDDAPLLGVLGATISAYGLDGGFLWTYADDSSDANLRFGKPRYRDPDGIVLLSSANHLLWLEGSSGALLSETALGEGYFSPLSMADGMALLRWSDGISPTYTYGAWDAAGRRIWSMQLGADEYGDLHAAPGGGIYLLGSGPTQSGKLGAVNSFLQRLDPLSGAQLERFQSTDRYEARHWTGLQAGSLR
jgi:hypothetical protein